MNARKVTCACARRFPRHGFKPPLLIWIELELLDHLAVQSPVATSRAAQIDRDRMIEWNRARTCEQVLPCLHQPHVQFVLSDPQRRGDPPSVSDLRQSSEPARSAARDLSGMDRSRHQEGRGRRARAPTVSWGFVLLQPGRAPRRVTNVRDDKILTSRCWTPSFQQRRCLVPASSYCEPDSDKPAKWHWLPSMVTRSDVCSRSQGSGSGGRAR